jgi:hypothetical protein
VAWKRLSEVPNTSLKFSYQILSRSGAADVAVTSNNGRARCGNVVAKAVTKQGVGVDLNADRARLLSERRVRPALRSRTSHLQPLRTSHLLWGPRLL